MAKIDSILKAAIGKKAACLSFSRTHAIRMLVNDQWVPFDPALAEIYVEELLSEVLNPREREEFLRKQSLTKLYMLPGVASFSIQVFRTLMGLEGMIRILQEAVPSPSELNIPQGVLQQSHAVRGLFVVQSQNRERNQLVLNSLAQDLAQNVSRQICVLQTRSNYLLKGDKSILYQREIGQTCPSYEQGVSDAISLGADVLVVDEVSSAAVARLLVEAAKSKLVLVALNAETSVLAEAYWGSFFADSERIHIQQEFKKNLVSIYMEKTGGTFSGILAPLTLSNSAPIPTPSAPVPPVSVPVPEEPQVPIVLTQKPPSPPPSPATPGMRPPPLTKKVG